MNLKNYLLPYVNINSDEFENFTNEFENKENIEEILHKYDEQILGKALNLNDEEITRVQKCRQKLINKRMRK